LEDAQVILDAHDIISERADDFKKYNYGGFLYEISKENEIEIFDVYDHIMVLCSPDYDKVNIMVGPGKALLCPHPVTPIYHTIKEEVQSIAFIASRYLPNRDAITSFIDNCWQQITARYPVRLSIYGTVCNDLKLPYCEQVSLKGFVPDINQIYEEADIIINPVRFGAGLKIKNMEALAHGVPLVTTSHGARGIETGINQCFLVGNDPVKFRQAIESLIESKALRKKLSVNAKQFIEYNYSAEKCFGLLMEKINTN